MAQLQEEMRAALTDVAAAKPAMPVGEAWMRHDIDPFDGSSAVVVGPTPEQIDRVLLRTADLPGPKPAIEWAIPSPAGTHIAVGISLDGREDATARVIDVETGELLPDAVPHLFLWPITWLADGSGFYARCGEVAMTDGWHPRTVLHRLGGPTEIDEAVTSRTGWSWPPPEARGSSWRASAPPRRPRCSSEGRATRGNRFWKPMRKQRTFDDLYAVVEDAIDRELAASGRIGFVGASNGGLTAGAAIIQRPELFRAVVCAIPVVDLISLPHLGLVRYIKEYGIPAFPDDIAEWARISPLQNLRDGVGYPAVLVDAGEVDTRCVIEPARAFAERLREIAGPTGHRVVLIERPNAGHVLAEGEVWPAWLDFFITELVESEA